MKFVAITLLAFVAAATAGPINVSDNNVGDIITVGINANVELSNHVEQNIISVIIALLDQDLGLIRFPDRHPEAPNVPDWPEWLTPEMVDRAREWLENRRQQE